MKKTKYRNILACLFLCIFTMFSGVTLHAEGSKQLTSDGDNSNGGYRPYTERYGARTAGIDREQRIYVYAKANETVYFGSSVYDASTNYDIRVTAVTLDSFRTESEVKIPYSGSFQETYDVQKAGKGYINSRTKEVKGPNHDGKSDGYDPLSFVVPSDGVYIFRFYSTGLTTDNPVSNLVQNLASGTAINNQQKKGTVAAWDVTVTNNAKEIEGRTWTYVLCLNIGSNTRNQNTLNSSVYVLTDDGYTYETDFNGMDPYGFIFFGNSRGLLDTVTNTSLYKSVKDPKKDNTLAHLKDINVGFHNPRDIDTEIDKTHKIFFSKPADDLPASLRTKVVTPSVNDFKFVPAYFEGDEANNVGLAGAGGDFIIQGDNITSFEIQLDFAKHRDLTNPTASPTNTTLEKRTLYGTFKDDGSGHNTTRIHWDGKDGNGKIVPAGIYTSDVDGPFATLVQKAGEFHFPMFDIENNTKGVIIKNITDEKNIDDTVYYNNTEVDTLKGYSNADGRTGVKSATSPASNFSNHHGDTVAIDLWSYTKFGVDTNKMIDQLKLSEKAIVTVEKIWKDGNNNDGVRPSSVTMQLMNNGEAVTDKAGNIVTAVLNKDNNWKYSWKLDEHSEKYDVAEILMDGQDAATNTLGYTINNETAIRDKNGAGEVIHTGVVIKNSYDSKSTTAQVEKIWDDNNDADGLRPKSLDVTLMADNAPVIDKDTEDYIKISLSDTNNFKSEVADLPMYTNGKKIEYSFVENEDVKGYIAETTQAGIKTTITNARFIEKNVKKIWNDDNNKNALRSKSVSVKLYQGDTLLDNVITLNEDNKWSTSLSLKKYDGTSEIKYRFEEDQIPNHYQASYKTKDDTTEITNTYVASTKPETPETKPEDKPGTPVSPEIKPIPEHTENQNKDAIDTSDSTRFIIYVVLGACALGVIAVIVFLRFKKIIKVYQNN